jgi:hypothetical protein
MTFSTKTPGKAYNKKPLEPKPKGKGVKDEKTTIEVIEFYQIKSKKNFTGTAHIYWENKNLDLRGIHITRYAKDKYFVHMPHFTGLDKDGNKVRYPFLHCPNAQVMRDLIYTIQKEMVTFIPKWIEENPPE